jgi:DNA repair exonuclease SbcCD ATPase subunit
MAFCGTSFDVASRPVARTIALQSTHPREPGPVTKPEWEALRQTLKELRLEGEQFDEFISDHLDQLDTLRLEIERRERVIADGNAELTEGRRALEAQRQLLENLRETTERNARQIRAEARRLAGLNGAAANGDLAFIPADDSDREARERERQALADQLSAARLQLSQVGDTLRELADARGALAEARAQIARLQLRLAQKRGHFDAPQRDALQEVQAERDRLAAELADAKRQLTERDDAHVALMLEELHQLRSLLERRQAEPAPEPTAGDSALDQVISQLEQLDRDMHAVKQIDVSWQPSTLETA